MKNNFKIIGYFVILMFVHLGCSENLDEQYGIDKILYFSKSGEMDITLYNTGVDTTLQITIGKSGYHSERPALARIDDMNIEEVNAFADRKGWKVKVIPHTCYSIEREVSFAQGEDYRLVKLHFNMNEVAKLTGESDKGEVKWILPFTLRSEESRINQSKNNIFYIINIQNFMFSFAPIGYTYERIEYKEDMAPLSFTQTISLNGEAISPLNCVLKVNEQVLEDYNNANEAQIELMPSAAYALDTLHIFAKGESKKVVKINVDCSLLKLDKTYGLPLQLVSDNADVDSGRSTHIWAVNIFRPVNLQKITLKKEMIKWWIQSGCDIGSILDGNSDTWCCGSYTDAGADNWPQAISINDLGLPQPQTSVMIRFQTAKRTGTMNEYQIQVKMIAESQWRTLCTLTAADGLPISKDSNDKSAWGIWYDSPICSDGMPFESVRLIGTGRNEVGKRYFSFAEFEIYSE